MSTRREFLQVVALASGGFALGVRWSDALAENATASFRPNAWLRIAPDGKVTVVVGKTEMGQGVRVSLPMLVAEELDVAVEDVALEQASPAPEYEDLGTGGSSSVPDGWTVLRKAGAAARIMLVAAAAERWNVAPERCRTENGRVVEIDGERALGYGDLVVDAARREPPADPPLRDRSLWKVLGTSPARPDASTLVDGRAAYGIDVRLPEQRFAVVARSPTLGGSLRGFDARATLATPGVEACFAIPSGVAIVARSTWAATRGRAALKTEWNPGPHAGFSSEAHRVALLARAEQPGIVLRRDGRGRDALADAARRMEAVYLYPFEAHAPIEPANATVHVSGGKCEVWAPTQHPLAVQAFAARVLGIARDEVTVHVTLAGGAFGRRLGWDVEVEAVEVARRIAHPVQLVWTRDDDLAHGYFQSGCAHRVAAGLDSAGRLVAWEQQKLSTPHNARGVPTAAQLVDPAYLAGSAWGIGDNPYAIPALEGSYTVIEHPVPIGPWRAVFAPSSVFAREAFLDEIAAETGADPLALRLRLLGADDPSVATEVTVSGTQVDRRRLRRTLERAAEMSEWSRPPAPGRARGIACDVFHNRTMTAYVVEVERTPAPGSTLPFRIVKAWGAIDCGVVVHPDGVIQQVESGIIWSLSNLKTEITFQRGGARETNFDGFEIARLADTPEIEVEIVPNDDEAPRGVGEPPVSAFAPAVINALSRLVGRRLRSLPVRSADLA